ncbi:hypothetical protein [Propionivibrio sp.]|uniref:hypothetical protein n=1 Tax=Propionivibrio sp. TaxID=2212460 RepID=UPI003BF1DC9D
MSQQINLYEERLRPRHELAIARNLGVGALALLLLMTGLALWADHDAQRKTAAAAVSQKQLADEQEQLNALVKTASLRRVSPALMDELGNVKALLSMRNEVMAVLDSGKLGKSTGSFAIMSGFSRQSQNGLWLTGFVATMGGEEIEIRGRLLDPAKLPDYVQRLRDEPVFQGRRFAALEMRDVEPVEQKTEQSQTDKPQTAAKMPRFVEFVLRSENMVATDPASRAGVKQ